MSKGIARYILLVQRVRKSFFEMLQTAVKRLKVTFGLEAGLFSSRHIILKYIKYKIYILYKLVEIYIAINMSIYHS